ncbi:MAG: ADP-ribosylglycohydrolase family protein [Candidatus Cyclobacteriaceae bacterium M3_2C_046]
MTGAIIGDIIGSVYEGRGLKSENFELVTNQSRFTDDSVLTIATADALLQQKSFEKAYVEWGLKYPKAGYGRNFFIWLQNQGGAPYHSFGNGSAMRVSPVAYFYQDLNQVLKNAKRSAEVTHNHPEGIKGAQATAAAIYLARNGSSKDDIRAFIQNSFDYNLSRSLDQIRPEYTFQNNCQGSVPESIIAFLESSHYEDAVRKAISLGGDADTMACIAGAIAEAYYDEVPEDLIRLAWQRLDKPMLEVLELFNENVEVLK